MATVSTNKVTVALNLAQLIKVSQSGTKLRDFSPLTSAAPAAVFSFNSPMFPELLIF